MNTPNSQQYPNDNAFPVSPQRKSNKLLWIILGVIIGIPTLLVGGCVTLLIVAGLTMPTKESKTERVAPEIEQPLTSQQKRWIVDVLKETDKLDAIYKKRTDARRYVEVGKIAEQKYFTGQDLLPEKDMRRNLLTNTMKAYQDVGVLLSNETGQIQESPDALMAAAGMRKVLLKKIIEGKLSAQEKELVDTLRSEWAK